MAWADLDLAQGVWLLSGQKTKNGQPVSKLVPYRRPVRSLWGLHAGRLELDDDLVVPTGERWEADS